MADVFNPGASAAKNNANQQAASVDNSKQAWDNAKNSFGAWLAANINPVAGASVAPPPTAVSPQQQIAQGIKPLVAGQQPAQAMIAPANHARQAHQAAGGVAMPQQPAPVNNAVVSQILAGA